jgi:hypothetical protein
MFATSASYDLMAIGTHRGFASVWSVLELLYCLPNEIQISEGKAVQPFSEFGDGPILAAQLLITLSGQESVYKFDSILQRIMALYAVENAKAPARNVAQFAAYAGFAKNAMAQAELIALPYKVVASE